MTASLRSMAGCFVVGFGPICVLVLCVGEAAAPCIAQTPTSPAVQSQPANQDDVALMAQVQAPSQSPPPAQGSPERRPDDMARLGSAINRLAAALEKDASDRAQDKEAARLQIVVGILGIRYRKIEELEAEMRRIEHEEDSMKDDLPLMHAEQERVQAQGRMPDGEPTPGAKEESDRLEMTIKLQEERIAKLTAQRMQLLNDVSDERRRLTHLEALIDTWLEKLQ